MKNKLIIFLLVVVSFTCQGCGIAYRNKIYDDFEKRNPKKIAMFFAKKSILERPGTIGQFSLSSIFPDTVDKGSSLAYKKTSKEGNFFSESQINDVFGFVLAQKGYAVENNSEFASQEVDAISNIIGNLKASSEFDFDAALFVDYSDMYNTYFARKGVSNNPGHAIYYRYALFDIETGKILVRYLQIVHPEFYSKGFYSEDDIVREISHLLIRDLNEHFPNSKRN